METLKCGACQTLHTDHEERVSIAGSGMCVQCSIRWLEKVEEQNRWDAEGGRN